jgi:4-diphosphocytidyl-2-C-methyl-D-erythritol kinase
MIFFPNAKINLGLFVTAKRADGYHTIQSILYPIPLYDMIEIITAADGCFELTNSGLSLADSSDENIVTKAWAMLRNDLDLPEVKIHLHKGIPTGAGLGGGSADAAFAIRLIDQHFNLGLSRESMEAYAGRLGMDCPFFIQNQAAYAFDRGDKLEAIDLKLSGKFLVLVKPNIHVSTANAYAGIVPAEPSTNLKKNIKKPMLTWKSFLANDFEKVVFGQYPQIAQIKDELYRQGAVYAQMSGSGSAVYGIFDKAVDLQANFNGMFYFASYLD